MPQLAPHRLGPHDDRSGHSRVLVFVEALEVVALLHVDETAARRVLDYCYSVPLRLIAEQLLLHVTYENDFGTHGG